MSVLILITARGGSVGVPRKNLRSLGGVPLIRHSINAALGCGIPDAEVICSTDDAEIAKVVSAAGVRVPFTRPAEYATSEASHLDVVFHALDWMATHEGREYAEVILLQPTAPFRTATHLSEAYQLFKQSNARSLVGVCEVVTSPYKMYTVNDGGTLSKLLPYRSLSHRKQDYPKVYQENGSIFIFTPEFLRTKQVFINESTIPYFMKQSESVDIDTEEDMVQAEFLMSRKTSCVS